MKLGGDKIAPKCFNVQNGSISIMKGEVLPFYRNIEGIAGKMKPEKKIQWLRDNYAYSCRDKEATGKVALDTMKCTFAVYAPDKDNKNEVYRFQTNCMNLNGWSITI